MQAFLQIFIALLAIASVWWLIRKMRRPQTPAEPADDPLADVPVPERRGPKGLAGAVAAQEPDDDEPADAFPPPRV
jgi:hypothetical protein